MKRSLFALLAVASLVLAAVPATAAAQSATTLAGSPKKAVDKAPDNVYIVRLAENPAVAYRGGIKATRPASAPAKEGQAEFDQRQGQALCRLPDAAP